MKDEELAELLDKAIATHLAETIAAQVLADAAMFEIKGWPARPKLSEMDDQMRWIDLGRIVIDPPPALVVSEVHEEL